MMYITHVDMNKYYVNNNIISTGVFSMDENLKEQLPLILYRLDSTTKVLEEIKIVLDRQTDNLNSLLVLQEKHNHLQIIVNDQKEEIEKLKSTVEENNSFIEKVKGALIILGIIQSIASYWVVDTQTQISQLKTSVQEIQIKTKDK